MRLLLFNKPFRVMCQFSGGDGRATLADYIPVRGVYPAGRLDYDSEGLLVLTDDGRLQARISDPRHRLDKVYWSQVEGVPDESALAALRRGVTVGGRRTKPVAAIRMVVPPGLWPRENGGKSKSRRHSPGASALADADRQCAWRVPAPARS